MAARGIISVDVEDYFQVHAFADIVDRGAWPNYPRRVERNTNRLLDLFDELDVKATFFILGWVAERHPGLVRRIAARGHEPACHSYWHRLVYTLTPDDFREDTERAKDVIEQTAGAQVYGYRAPSFSITERSLWAFEVLAELGFRYDSSVFPIRHDLYGIKNAARRPVSVKTPSGPILEFPLATFHCRGEVNLPVAGGGYLRMLPFWYTRAGVERAWRDGLPVVSYVHPWELDPEQPRLNGSFKSRLRHYTGLKRAETRLRKLLALDRFVSFRDSGYVSPAPSIVFEEAAAR
jgi:polysaccharide deacetylase family protein (PEP-CTERM system associated)